MFLYSVCFGYEGIGLGQLGPVYYYRWVVVFEFYCIKHGHHVAFERVGDVFDRVDFFAVDFADYLAAHRVVALGDVGWEDIA